MPTATVTRTATTAAPKTTTVFRSGVVEVGVQRGEWAKTYAYADARRPAGRAGRGSCIYASPTLQGVTRWVLGNRDMRGIDPTPRSVTIDPANVWVYSVRAWEKASWGAYVGENTPDKQAAYDAYWATGVPLTEWAALAEANGWNAGDWEVLVPADAVRSHRTVSNRRVIEAASGHRRRELMWMLEPKKATKSIYW